LGQSGNSLEYKIKMVYLRSKKVKGDQYLYLVQSVWDPKKATSRQEIIRYLGKASRVSKNDIPKEYRNDKKISTFLASYNYKFGDHSKMVKKYRKNLLQYLQDGNLEKSLGIYSEYRKIFGTTDFYEKILRSVMYEIGRLWEQNKISIGTEQVCSNVVQNLIHIIKQKNIIFAKKGKVLICTPVGEEHSIGCNILECYLLCKGFQVFNLAPPAPADSVLSVIEEKKPKAVFVSITLEDNLKAGQRLVNKIKERYDIPIIVGGQAITHGKLILGAKTFTADSLSSLPTLLSSI
jgi:methanogenic corrinoid protein MtbC1